ncbi:MAG: phenylalanine--tRNA ligase beta subunit-related protein [Candidatus Pacebacteria bacterium]|nr:phenylalanine--tRNA ligase beta subunit-related protein [Candidatus Paceibacterota bacterium]
MKISYNWLNAFLNNKAPEAQKVADALTMNSMEVEGVEKLSNDFLMEVKTTPDKNHSCLCHRGIANEVGAVLNIKTVKNSRDYVDFKISEINKKIGVKIEDEKLPARPNNNKFGHSGGCRRYIGRVIENVKVGPSPVWLKERLESVGQRSINNVVDATNFVMFDIGQPMHVFDADRIDGQIIVRKASQDEQVDLLGHEITAKGGETKIQDRNMVLSGSELVITDNSSVLALAGIKGGKKAELTDDSVNLFLESANFDPVCIRKTATFFKLQTDATKRYENEISPEIASEAMDILTRIIVETAGTPDTKVGEVVDNYPRRANKFKLGISSEEASSIIGADIKDSDIEDIFNRFGFEWKKVKPVDDAVKLAQSLVDVPYKYGASVLRDAPEYFDCSGFISYIFAQVGVQIPRMSVDQYVWGNIVDKNEIKPGDVIFVNTGDLKRKIDYQSIEFIPGTKVELGVDHCGLYIDNNKIIHCTESRGVVIEDLNKSESFKNIVGYRRMSDNKERFVIIVPDERLDLRIKEDLAEDIGRIYGYDKVKDLEIPKNTEKPKIDQVFAYKQRIKEILYEEGFCEVMNYSFVESGDFELANSISPEKRFLRTELSSGMKKCLEFNARYSELIDMQQIRVFEFGHVFPKSGEKNHFIVGVKNPLGFKTIKEKEYLESVLKKLEEKIGFKLNKINNDENIAEFDLNLITKGLPELTEYKPEIFSDLGVKFKHISQYPFMIRDIAVFTKEGTKPEEVFEIISSEAGELMIKNRLFDVFTKNFPDGTSKTSYAYRLVFQSYEKTLSDDEVNVIMQRITDKMNAKDGWQVR